MNQTQYIQLGQDECGKEHTGHPVKRKWNDSFLQLEQVDAMENDGHIMKAPHTSLSVSSSDDTDGTKIDIEEEDEDIKVKRKAQNRAAQRAFRERKERYVKDLELKIKQVQDSHVFTTNQLFQENHHLRSIICRLEAENSALKGVIPLATTSTNNTNNTNGTNTNNTDLFASLGLLSPGSQLPGLDLPSLPPISLHPSSTMGIPDTLGYHPIQLGPMTGKHSHPKPLASKPPVPILPQQPQRTQPIITAKLSTQNNKKASRSSSKSANTANNAAHQSKSSSSPLQSQQQHPSSQQQEFTFSISTPATLRADTSGKNNQMDPIELIPLYHPDHHGQHSSPSSDKIDLEEESPNNNVPSSIIVRNDDDQDQDGGGVEPLDGSDPVSLGSFLDGYDAFERLYVHQDHSLFDDNGLALSMMQSRRNSVTTGQQQETTTQERQQVEETVPLNEEKVTPTPTPATETPSKPFKEDLTKSITTTLADEEESLTMMLIKDKKVEAMIKNQKASSGSADSVVMMGNDDLVDLSCSQHSHQQQPILLLQQQQQPGQHPQHQGATAIIPSEDDEKTPIWQKITEHAQNNKFSVDHLVEAVRNTTTSKRKNKLLVDEWELEAMVHDLNYYL